MLRRHVRACLCASGGRETASLATSLHGISRTKLFLASPCVDFFCDQCAVIYFPLLVAVQDLNGAKGGLSWARTSRATKIRRRHTSVECNQILADLHGRFLQLFFQIFGIAMPPCLILVNPNDHPGYPNGDIHCISSNKKNNSKYAETWFCAEVDKFVIPTSCLTYWFTRSFHLALLLSL